MPTENIEKYDLSIDERSDVLNSFKHGVCIYIIHKSCAFIPYWKSLDKFMFVWTRIMDKKLTDSFLNRFILSLVRCVKYT